MNNENYAREMTRISLSKELSKIEKNYMKIYDEYYSIGSRDSAFLKDLVDGIQGISAVLEVYTEYGKIHSDYAVEKLKNSMSYIKSTINYFESRKNDEI